MLYTKLFPLFENAFVIFTVNNSQGQVGIQIFCGPEIKLKATLTFITFIILNTCCQDQVAIQIIHGPEMNLTYTVCICSFLHMDSGSDNHT